jgi:hypothetical protein
MRDVRSVRLGIVTALVSAVVLHALPGSAQTDDELTAARKLFTEAVADQDSKLYETALEKFRKVAAVKDTANVRFRVASCLEALGRRPEALASYEAAKRLGAGDAGAADVVRAASDRATQLDRALPRLTVLVPGDAPPGTVVQVDANAVDPAALHDGMPIEPGQHTVSASAPGDLPFRTGVTLGEGARVTITVALQPVPPPPPPPPPVPPVDSVPTRTAGSGAPAGAWIALGAGGLLAAGSITSFVLRASNLSTMNRDCQSGGSGSLSCPTSVEGEVHGARNAALVEGPLGIGLAAGAVVAAGVGVWLLASSRSGGVQVVPAVTQAGALLVVHGALGR